jgi:hypothetical protein
MADLAPESEYGRLRANPRQAGWVPDRGRKPDSRSAASTSGAKWTGLRSDPEPGNPARLVRQLRHPQSAARLLAWRADYKARQVRTCRATPSGCICIVCIFPAAPGSWRDCGRALTVVFAHDRSPPSDGKSDTREAAIRCSPGGSCILRRNVG